MAVSFPQIEALPRKRATQVKNKWGDLVRDVRRHGSIAVTSHDKVELVVMEVGRYQEIARLLETIEKRRQSVLVELTAEFDERLAALNAPDARARIEAAMHSEGRVVPRPKAGTSF